MKINRKGKLSTLVISLDIIAFALVMVGAGMIRMAKDEFISISGGLVMAIGVALLGITRYIPK